MLSCEYSGEHFNISIFWSTNELSHSAILTNLVNKRGHGRQKRLCF
jgi:hypothetical protein